jgi:hypothetical protein
MRNENENAAECRLVQEHTWTKEAKSNVDVRMQCSIAHHTLETAFMRLIQSGAITLSKVLRQL